MLEVISVNLYRNKRLIFHNFNLKLAKSQTMILIGNNGVGKTSLFELIVGVLEPDNGYVKINNIPNKNLEEKKKFVFTYLPHKDSLKSNLTVFENLRNWINISGLAYDQDSMNKILNYFDLYGIRDFLLEKLSQGQKKKVSLSKLLISKSNLWLLDEPYNGLDQSSIKKLNKLIVNHSKNGGSTLLSNHIEIKIPRSKKIFLKKPESSLNQKLVNFDSWKDIK
ncbi:MAG: heme ABC exporter ATP-binding protein CcmA [Alphaproteobacteria bacterium]